jgi:ComF family protein
VLKILKNIFESLLDLFFPASCLICSEYLEEDVLVCTNCLHNLKLHRNENKSYLSVFSYSDKIRILIHELKYNNRPEIGRIMGKEMGSKLKRYINPDRMILLPVPLHKKRLRKRGYNQSEMICAGFSEIINIPVETGLLIRRKNNISQTALNASGRSENVKGIFEAGSAVVDPETTIFIVDDLITTGATTREAVSELKKQGYKKFFSLCIATSTKGSDH